MSVFLRAKFQWSRKNGEKEDNQTFLAESWKQKHFWKSDILQTLAVEKNPICKAEKQILQKIKFSSSLESRRRVPRNWSRKVLWRGEARDTQQSPK